MTLATRLAVCSLIFAVPFTAQLNADVVVPNVNEEVDAGSQNRFPFLVNGGMRYQQVYDASQFGTFATGGELITGMLLRPDTQYDPFSRTINNLTFNLSTTAAGPDSLSATFANNVGADNTTVLSGNILVSTADLPGPGDTRDFDVLFSFDTPFFYDPTNGNLLVDILNADPASNSIGEFFDSTGDTAGDSVGRVFGQEYNPGASVGTISSSGLVTKFTTEIPEISINLDIKPGPSNNTVALNGNGTLQMAILASADLDVANVDIDSLLFGDPILVDGGAAPLGATSDKLRDINHDGLDDLLVGFSISDLVDGGALDAASVEGRLTGELFDGTRIVGSDIVRMVPQNNGGGGSLAIATVPEPATCTLAFAALCLALSRRRDF